MPNSKRYTSTRRTASSRRAKARKPVKVKGTSAGGKTVNAPKSPW